MGYLADQQRAGPLLQPAADPFPHRAGQEIPQAADRPGEESAFQQRCGHLVQKAAKGRGAERGLEFVGQPGLGGGEPVVAEHSAAYPAKRFFCHVGEVLLEEIGDTLGRGRLGQPTGGKGGHMVGEAGEPFFSQSVEVAADGLLERFVGLVFR